MTDELKKQLQTSLVGMRFYATRRHGALIQPGLVFTIREVDDGGTGIVFDDGLVIGLPGLLSNIKSGVFLVLPQPV